MNFLPVFLAVRQQRCLVIGGDEIALRKIRLLLSAGAHVHVVGENVCAEVVALMAAQSGEVSQRRYQATDLDHVALIVVAEQDDTVATQIASEARVRQIPVNVVDRPALCSFIFPSIVERDPLVIGISTGGASPVLARALRARLESRLPAGIGQLIRAAGELRTEVNRLLPEMPQRLAFWNQLLEDSRIDDWCALQPAALYEALQHQLVAFARDDARTGSVSLVGAGTGESDLLTFRALQRLQHADAVFYWPTVAPSIVELARRDAARHPLQAAEDWQHVIALAQAGKQVVCLYPGTPAAFFDFQQHCTQLRDHQLTFDVVAGVALESNQPLEPKNA